jgi:hypothetical protein
MARTPSNQGYWLVGSDGGIFCFGDAPFKGSMGGQHLNAPVVGMAATSTGQGYWLVASDGGMFCFGDAPFKGSMGGQHLNAPVVGMAATSTGQGYWLVGADGGMFCFGDAPFKGSMGGQHLNAPIVGMAATTNNGGYWLVGMREPHAAPFERIPWSTGTVVEVTLERCRAAGLEVALVDTWRDVDTPGDLAAIAGAAIPGRRTRELVAQQRHAYAGRAPSAPSAAIGEARS